MDTKNAHMTSKIIARALSARPRYEGNSGETDGNGTGQTGTESNGNSDSWVQRLSGTMKTC